MPLHSPEYLGFLLSLKDQASLYYEELRQSDHSRFLKVFLNQEE